MNFHFRLRIFQKGTELESQRTEGGKTADRMSIRMFWKKKPISVVKSGLDFS